MRRCFRERFVPPLFTQHSCYTLRTWRTRTAAGAQPRDLHHTVGPSRCFGVASHINFWENTSHPVPLLLLLLLAPSPFRQPSSLRPRCLREELDSHALPNTPHSLLFQLFFLENVKKCWPCTEHKRRRVDCPSDDADKKKTSNRCRGDTGPSSRQRQATTRSGRVDGQLALPAARSSGVSVWIHERVGSLVDWSEPTADMYLHLCDKPQRQSRSLHPSALKLSDSVEMGDPLTSPASDVATRMNCTVSYYLGEYMESEKQESAVDEVKSQLECKLEVLEVSNIGCFTGKDLLPRLGSPR